MSNPDFVYTTYIKTTPEKCWAAITNPEFSRQYWMHAMTSDWKIGAKWELIAGNGDKTTVVAGKILESNPPKRLVFTWADPTNPSDESKVTFEIEAVEDMVRLNVIHGSFKADSDMMGKIAIGWPRVLSSMKSFLETGKALDMSKIKGSCSA